MRVWCFQCGAEYVADVETCVECGTATIDHQPIPAELVGDETEAQMAYELHEWSPRGRLELDQLLRGDAIVHGWQGATLIVRELDEAAVDDAVARAEKATLPTLDPDAELVGYSLDGYDDEARARLVQMLELAGVAWEMDDAGELIVTEADEQDADDVFERLAAGPEEVPTFGPGIEGVDPAEAVSALFLAADRLRRAPADPRHVLAYVEACDTAEMLELPFGFEPRFWRTVLDTSTGLREDLHGEVPDTDLIRELATLIRDRLRDVI